MYSHATARPPCRQALSLLLLPLLLPLLLAPCGGSRPRRATRRLFGDWKPRREAPPPPQRPPRAKRTRAARPRPHPRDGEVCAEFATLTVHFSSSKRSCDEYCRSLGRECQRMCDAGSGCACDYTPWRPDYCARSDIGTKLCSCGDSADVDASDGAAVAYFQRSRTELPPGARLTTTRAPVYPARTRTRSACNASARASQHAGDADAEVVASQREVEEDGDSLERQVLSAASPSLRYYPRFLTHEESDHLIAAARGLTLGSSGNRPRPPTVAVHPFCSPASDHRPPADLLVRPTHRPAYPSPSPSWSCPSSLPQANSAHVTA